jgi:two-component system copper resistance phosphate regulon response regulator CusR
VLPFRHALEAASAMTICVIDDEEAILDFLRRALSEQGYHVKVARSAEEVLPKIADGNCDLFIVDLGLPGMDGLEFIVQCRRAGVKTPVLILSARRAVDERVLGLEKGGDDYLTKPFALAELLARVRALLRRGAPAQAESTTLKVADLELDLLRHEVRRGGQVLTLTAKEFALLEYLCRNAGRVVTRTMVLDRVWGMRFDPSTNVVDVHIHRLRSKIDGGSETKLIHTIRGAGYVLAAR